MQEMIGKIRDYKIVITVNESFLQNNFYVYRLISVVGENRSFRSGFGTILKMG